MLKRYWWAFAAIAIAAIAVVIFARYNAQQPSVATSPAVAVATVRYGDYAVVLDESGYVGAPAGTTTQLAFPNPGVLEHLYVRVGQRVAPREELATQDTRALALDAAQARADAQAAAAGYRGGAIPAAAVRAAQDRAQAAQQRVAADRAGVDRMERLYAAGIDALKDVQAARATLAADVAEASTAGAELSSTGSQPAVAAAQVRAANARAASAAFSVAQGTLIAPTGGYVTEIFHRTGEAVDATKPVLAVGPPQDEVTLTVPGTDAVQIATGNPVALSVAGSQNEYRGRVTAIVPAVNPATQSATAVVSGAPPGAIAGTAVRARITVARVRGLLIPESAIVADPQRAENVVFVRRQEPDGSVRFVQRVVSIAHEDGTTAQIGSGLRAGEQIATEGAFQLLVPRSGGE